MACHRPDGATTVASPTRTRPGATTSHQTPKVTSSLPRRSASALSTGRVAPAAVGVARGHDAARRRLGHPQHRVADAHLAPAPSRARPTPRRPRRDRHAEPAPVEGVVAEGAARGRRARRGTSASPGSRRRRPPHRRGRRGRPAPDVLRDRGRERPLDHAAGDGAAVVERGGHRGAGLDRRRDHASRRGTSARARARRASHAGTICTSFGWRVVSAAFPSAPRRWKARSPAGPVAPSVDRVDPDQPHALDRREVERRDDRHVSGAAAASGP